MRCKISQTEVLFKNGILIKYNLFADIYFLKIRYYYQQIQYNFI